MTREEVMQIAKRAANEAAREARLDLGRGFKDQIDEAKDAALNQMEDLDFLWSRGFQVDEGEIENEVTIRFWRELAYVVSNVALEEVA